MKLFAVLAVLGVSYAAKQQLLSEWERFDRTGTNNLNQTAASYLIAASIPWDVTVTPWTTTRSVLLPQDKKVFLMPVSVGLAYIAFKMA